MRSNSLIKCLIEKSQQTNKNGNKILDFFMNGKRYYYVKIWKKETGNQSVKKLANYSPKHS